MDSRDSSAKRFKYSEDTGTWDFNSFNTLCRNFLMNNIAVEFHDDNIIKKITYREIEIAKLEIEEILLTIDGSQFIALDLEIQDFCIPSLILGIISSGRGFINISPLKSQDLCFRLKVIYMFTQNSIPDTELIHRINVHDESIQLLKLKTILDNENKSDFQKNRFAYAITTSGTTGIPKIVKVPHDSIVLNILDLRNIFSITEKDKIAQLTTLTFDPSIVEIFLGLCSSCTLFMASRNLKNKPRKLLEVMAREKVTLIQTTPSLLFGQFSKKDIKDRIFGEKSNLRILVLGGEPFPKIEALKSIRDEQNQTRIFNIYGITEVSCWASIEEFNGENMIDICHGFLGRPLSQTFFQVRTENDKIVEEGEGILFIGSRKRICLIDDEEINLSSPVFRNTGDAVMIDNTRRIFYKGRHNKVIKRFGNKVDLSKLENVILKMKSVQNCYAIWNETDQKLHVCISQITNFEKGDNRMKFDVMNNLQSLPSFYRPDEIHLISNFPLTENGKICFQSLKKICTEYTDSNKFPFQNLESIFHNLWKLLAGSLECGFIKSGGTSVAALQIVNSLSEKFDQEFPELLGLLLNDANYSNCVTYIDNQMKDNKLSSENGRNSELKIEIFASSSGNVSQDKKVEKENLINCGKKLTDTCLWQKCRGFTIGQDGTKDQEEISLTRNMRFEVLKSFDIKKCVDASPTIFQYSNGKLFATVGSHSGIIITVEINSNLNSYVNYITELPDRIEASVLVFDHFRGVVGCYDGNVYCLNLKTGETFWKFQTGDAVKSTAATCSEKKNIFIGSYDRHMYCLSLETGLELWRMKASEGSISGTARLHLETRSLLFGTLDGRCVSLDQVSGKIKWRYSFADPVFSAPAILETGNVIFASVSGKLACFNIQSGQRLWTYTISGNIFSHLVVVKSPESSQESIMFASRNKILYHLECDLKPSLKFSATTENPIIATPWNAGKIILIACIDGTLQILDSISQEILASHKLPGEVFSSPVLHQDFIVVGCRDNKLYILKLVN